MRSHNSIRQLKLKFALLPLCLALAFQCSYAIQGEQQVGPNAELAVAAPSGPMMTISSESSSALESSAALAADDLIAAESSQTPEAAEHKSFTSGQILRQEAQQAASVAPVSYQPQGPVAQHQQQVPQHPQATQQHQRQMFNMHPQHMMQQQHVSRVQPHQKPFNPFMAAALAGNYGPAQQQIAAAAAAGMHAVHGPHQQSHGPNGNHAHGPHAMHPNVAQMGQHQAPHHQPQQMMANQAHQVNPMGAAPVVNHHMRQQVQAEQPNGLAVQESSVRSNIVPAPSFNSMVDSNSIELNDAPQQVAPVASQQQVAPTGSSQMAAAASGQHPVIASASTAMQESAASSWPLQAPDIPKIVNLEVKCEKNLMKVSVEFDKVFNGVIFSKGHYSQGQCIHVNQNSGKQQAYFDISINSCGTQGNTQNGLYGMGGNSGSGTYFENTIVIQYDPNVQEVYDHARKLRCTWHDQYEKAVTFRPFPVDMLDIIRADFAGDNVGCWMQIQVGKGPWASEVAGIVKIGQTMTMVLAIKDEENKFDMLVRNCFAHDGKRGPIELVDKSGCITRPKLMSKFTKIKNFGSSATVLSYAHFQAFKFPDSMEVHFQCTIQICRHQCPEQCSAGTNTIGSSGSTLGSESYSESTISGTFNINGNSAGANQASDQSAHLRKFGSSSGLSRERRDLSSRHSSWLQAASNGSQPFTVKPMTQTVGLNRIIQVVSTGDLAFAVQQQQLQSVNGTLDAESLADSTAAQLSRLDMSSQICMSSYNFVLSLVVLMLVLLCSSLVAISMYLRQKNYARQRGKLLLPSASTCSTPTLRPQQVPSQQQLYNQMPTSNHHHSHAYRQ